MASSSRAHTEAAKDPCENRDYTALILAAGQSKRMGTAKAKLLLHDEQAWQRLARLCLQAGCFEVVVLLSEENLGNVEAEAETAGLAIRFLAVPLELAKNGPVGSLMHGIQHSQPQRAWLVCPVDHPFVAQESLLTLINSEADIAIPLHDGRRGHPVLVAERYRAKLLGLTKRGETLRDFIHAHSDDVTELLVDDPAIRWNCNLPEDFARHLETFRGQKE